MFGERVDKENEAEQMGRRARGGRGLENTSRKQHHKQDEATRGAIRRHGNKTLDQHIYMKFNFRVSYLFIPYNSYVSIYLCMVM